MAFYALTIFISAFLLFQVQPIIAKVILPWFGGSSAVWSTCMLFFQVGLLLGYLYAHWLTERLAPRKQAILHSALLAVSLASLPILPGAAWKPSGAGNPSWQILLLLSATIGLPYFLLSSTSPLLQAWYARTRSGAMPYRLYALSNAASLLALLSYPLLVEPWLPTRLQGYGWSGAYVCFAALCAATAWLGLRSPASREEGLQAEEPEAPPAPGWWLRLLWMGLAACASVLLLAVTAYLTQDVAAIPFLWIVPLSVYLLSFIICFEAPRLYLRPVFYPLLACALGGMAYILWSATVELEIVTAIAVFVAALFVCSMVCHGELARLKPHPRFLTTFYVMVSLGGAAGGTFVGLVAPNLFNAYYEFPIGMGLCAVLAAAVLVVQHANFFRKWWRLAAVVVPVCAYLYFLGVVIRNDLRGYRVIARNFYGELQVEDYGAAGDEGACRKLIHGVINHGQQMRNDGQRLQPTTYYCQETGVGRALRARPSGVPARVGIVGLGCGTLLAYGQPGDTFRVYEINPLVLELAQTEFSFLRETPAKVEIALGDARLSLEREPSQGFDILAIDAFSGDSVPVHLLTLEAFQTYFRHLKPTGILAVHISNKYLDFKPVLERVAARFGKAALDFEYSPPDEDERCFSSTWVLLADPAVPEKLGRWLSGGERLKSNSGFRIWTDDFSDMARILKERPGASLFPDK